MLSEEERMERARVALPVEVFARMREEGMSFSEVAREVGLRYGDVVRWGKVCLPEALWGKRRKRRVKRMSELVDEMLRRAPGADVGEVAKAVGCSRSLVEQRRIRLRIEAREGTGRRCSRCEMEGWDGSEVGEDGLCGLCREELRTHRVCVGLWDEV